MPDRVLRLGEVIDDYCPRCRLLLNHDIASLAEGRIAQTTCRTCFNAHEYRDGQIPARRKSTKKPDNKTLMDQVLASMPAPPDPQAMPIIPIRKKRDLWADVERLRKK